MCHSSKFPVQVQFVSAFSYYFMLQVIIDHFAIQHTISLLSGPCGHLINAGYEYVALDFTLPIHTLPVFIMNGTAEAWFAERHKES